MYIVSVIYHFIDFPINDEDSPFWTPFSYILFLSRPNKKRTFLSPDKMRILLQVQNKTFIFWLIFQRLLRGCSHNTLEQNFKRSFVLCLRSNFLFKILMKTKTCPISSVWRRIRRTVYSILGPDVLVLSIF